MKLIFIIPLVVNFFIAFFIYRYFISNLLIYKMPCESLKGFKAISIIFTLIISLMPPLFFIANHEGLSTDLVKISSYFMGIIFVLLFVTIFYLLGLLLVKSLGFASAATSQAVVFIEFSLLSLTILYILLAFIGGAQAPIVKPIKLTIEGWQKPGYKIVQLSDLHIGSLNNKFFMESVVNEVNRINPDLVVITGDLIDVPLEHILEDLAPLKNLEAPSYAVLGNHEYYNGIYGLKSTLKELGTTLLMNESVIIDQSFNLLGINDPTGTRFGQFEPDFKKTVSLVQKNLPSILLAHQPVMVKEIDESINLMLSGHTHNGQIFPFNWIIRIIQPYVNGLYTHHQTGTLVYVNPGTGFWGPPMRLGSKAEITLFTIN